MPYGFASHVLVARLAAWGIAGAILLTGALPVSAQEVRLNEVVRSLFFTPQHVALRIGAFEQEGLKIAGPKTTWGAQAAVTEIVSGNSDIALVGLEATIVTRNAGPDRRLVLFAGLTNGDGTFIVSKNPMEKFSAADLKGKTIVTSGKGSSPALSLEHLIRGTGLNPGKDVNVRYIPVSANIMPSFLEPKTDFGQAFEPFIEQMVRQKRGHRVASVGALLGPMAYSAYAAPVSYIQKNPEILQAFTNAIYRGLIWTEKNSPEAIAKLIAPDFKSVPEEMIAAVVDQYKKNNIWPRSPLITPEGADRMLEVQVSGGMLKEKMNYEQVVNPSFAQKVLQSIKQ